MPRGGHFAALEESELLVDDIRRFFRPLRGDGTRHATGRSAETMDTGAPGAPARCRLCREFHELSNNSFVDPCDSNRCPLG